MYGGPPGHPHGSGYHGAPPPNAYNSYPYPPQHQQHPPPHYSNQPLPPGSYYYPSGPDPAQHQHAYNAPPTANPGAIYGHQQHQGGVPSSPYNASVNRPPSYPAYAHQYAQQQQPPQHPQPPPQRQWSGRASSPAVLSHTYQQPPPSSQQYAAPPPQQPYASAPPAQQYGYGAPPPPHNVYGPPGYGPSPPGSDDCCGSGPPPPRSAPPPQQQHLSMSMNHVPMHPPPPQGNMPYQEPEICSHPHGKNKGKGKSKEDETAASGGGFAKMIGQKLVEGLSWTANATTRRVERIKRFNSKAESDSPPEFSYLPEEHAALLQENRTAFSADEVEQLYYMFRNITLNTYEFDENCVAMLFPMLDQALILRIWSLLSPTQAKLDFDSYAIALSALVKSDPHARLPVVWKVLVGDRMGKLARDSAAVIFNHLRETLLRLGYGEDEEQYGSTEVLLAELWPDAKTEDVTYGSFVMHRWPEDHYVYKLFGFFEYLTDLSLNRLDGSPPSKEGWLKKSFSAMSMKERWKKHWCVVRSGFFWYYKADEVQYKTPARVLTLSRDAEIRCLTPSELNCDGAFGFLLKQPGYERKFACSSVEAANAWCAALQLNLPGSKNRFSSFSVIRHGTNARWMVDGSETYEEMRKALLFAKHEIFIADWFLSPQVYLRRPTVDGVTKLSDDDLLSNVLKKKAEEGVRVYVLPWNETKVALNLDSAYCERFLESLHKNIRVMRHPLVTPMKWSHHQKLLIVDQNIAFVGGLDLCYGRWDDRNHRLIDPNPTESQTWRGKDYYNPLFQEIADVDKPWVDSLNRQNQARMPWHDIHMVCDGAAARDVARNFIQRWNHHKDVMSKEFYPYLTPSGAGCPRAGTAAVQVVRSVAKWSAGVEETEDSIYRAYRHYIERAEHFIYIENQFFISSTAGHPVKNKITEALLWRISKAVAEKTTFRVIIIVPVHPEGTYQDSSSVRYLMAWQYKTINRGETSLLSELEKRFPNIDVSQYITFHSLRNWARLRNNLVTEQIYIHSKLMIVDDRVVIVGSANINDRSLLGDRDSEIAVIVEDHQLERGCFDGQSFAVSNFAHTLRVSLWSEHLGLPGTDPRLEDPISHASYMELWKKRSAENTSHFKEVFPVIPHSDTGCLHAIEYQPCVSASASGRLNGVQGFLTDYALDFLKDEDMKASGLDAVAGDDVYV